MASNKHAEQIRDKFKQDCKECYDLAEKEIRNFFDEIGYENRCNQGFLYEELRSTENKVRYMTDFFSSGPKQLITSEGFGSTWFYQCVLYSHELGMRLIRLAEELQSTIECDEI